MSSHAPGTPSRNGLPFPYPGTPQSRTTSSSSTTPPTVVPSTSSSSAKPTAAPITLAALLSQHASAPNPHAAALEQALNERNQLSSQNSQLWKLIEKQRSGYNQMLKELERVRAERDALRGKANGTSSSSKEKALKNSVSSSAMSGSTGPNGSSSNHTTLHDAKPIVARHHSDDIGE